MNNRNRILLAALLALTSPLLAMQVKPQFTQQRYEQADQAIGDFYSAVVNCEPEKVSVSLDRIMELRKRFSFWDPKCWWETANEKRVRNHLFDTKSMIDAYFNARNNSLNKSKEEYEQSNIIKTIKRKLGYGRYVESDDAQNQLMQGINELNPPKIKAAIDTIRKVRSQFSFLERMGITLPAGLWIAEEWSRNRLFDRGGSRSWEVFKVLSETAEKNNDPDKIKETIQAIQEEYDVQGITKNSSNGQQSHQSTFLRSAPALLEAFYRMNTPMNSKRLLAHAQEDQKQRQRSQDEIISVILKHNPQLKANS